MAAEDPTRGPQGEGPRYQPEFSAGERLARLEALYEAFRRTEVEWQEQIDRRFGGIDKDIRIQRDERVAELTALRRESQAALEAQDKAINKAGDAQEKQNELTREEAQRAREGMETRLLALERGESRGEGKVAHTQQINAAVLAWAGVAIVAISVAVSLIIKFSG